MKRPDTLFLQIHTLTAYTASLLNRDDIGRAKRLPYGGKSRVRISSQCLKRHWREVDSEWALNSLEDPRQGGQAALTVRSRKIFAREIAEPLVEQDGFPADSVIAVVSALKSKMLGESTKAKAEKAEREAKKKGAAAAEPVVADLRERMKVLDLDQVVVLGRPEIDYMRGLAAGLLRDNPNDLDKAVEALLKRKETTENLRAMRLASGLDAALFGRMVTSDILARGDGAIHVAHALTLHGEEAEPEYFVAIDDLTRDAGELGTGLIQTTELTSGLFYGYVVVDVPLLVSNLEGVKPSDWRKADLGLARTVIDHLVQVIATTSPGAKLGSTAPYAYADTMLIEAGTRQPRSLMTAFHRAVREDNAQELAVKALAGHLASFDCMYGSGEQRRFASMQDVADPSLGELDPGGIAGLARWAANQIAERSA